MTGSVEIKQIKNRFERKVTLFGPGMGAILDKYDDENVRTGHQYILTGHVGLYTDLGSPVSAVECDFFEVTEKNPISITDVDGSKYAYLEVIQDPYTINLEADKTYEWLYLETVYNGKTCILIFIKTLWPDV